MFRAGMIYHQLGDHAKARVFLAKALSLNPVFHPLHAKTASDTLKLIHASAQPATH